MHFKCERPLFGWVLARCCFPTHKKSTTHNVARFLMWWGQQGSSTAKRKCLHFEASVQCDRGTGAHGVSKGGETALFEPANCFPTHKKSTTYNVARFLMWWGQQGSNL